MDSKTSGHSKPRLYGIGQAFVVSVRNETLRHVVKINHPNLGITDFIPFIQTPGLYRVPRVGDLCYVFCNENFAEYPMAWGHKPSKELVTQLIGTREDDIMVIYSSGKDNRSVTHKITFDDGEADPGLYIETGGGNSIRIQDEKDITVTHNTGSQIRINDSIISLTVKGTSLTMSDQGLILTSAKGASVNITDAVINQSNAGSKVDVNTGVNIESSEGSKIDVTSTVEVKASDQQTKIDDIVYTTHQHSGNIGFPTSPPIKQG
jgi:hypothetical protein